MWFIYSIYIYIIVYSYIVYTCMYIYILHILYICIYIYIIYIYTRIPEHNQHNSYIGVCENGAYSYRMAIKYSRTWWFINQRILGYPIFDKATWPTWNLVAAQKKAKEEECAVPNKDMEYNIIRVEWYIYIWLYIYTQVIFNTNQNVKKTCWTKKELGPWGVQLRKKL